MSLIKQHLYNQMRDLEDDQQSGTDPPHSAPDPCILKESKEHTSTPFQTCVRSNSK
jgi:hypothetical protein